MKHIILIISVLSVLLMFNNFVLAQTDNVGIGTTTPHPATLLDMEYDAGANPAKGIRVPYANDVQMNDMYNDYGGNLPDGLLIYNTDQSQYMFYRWDTPLETVPVNGEWLELTTGSSSQNSNVPSGAIMMWSGTIASIPAGWALCDGSAPSPFDIDLTDKFIVSVASAAENPGTAPVPGEFVEVQSGSPTAPQRRFFKLAYIIKL